MPPPQTPFGVLAVVAALGALLPDLDARGGKLQSLSIAGVRPLAPISAAAHAVLGHRGMMHSVTALLILGLLVTPTSIWIGFGPMAALMLGYASHLLADAGTPSGVPFFYPDLRRWHVLPRRLRITTGSVAEQALFPFLLAAVGSLLLGAVRCLVNAGPWS